MPTPRKPVRRADRATKALTRRQAYQRLVRFHTHSFIPVVEAQPIADAFGVPLIVEKRQAAKKRRAALRRLSTRFAMLPPADGGEK